MEKKEKNELAMSIDRMVKEIDGGVSCGVVVVGGKVVLGLNDKLCIHASSKDDRKVAVLTMIPTSGCMEIGTTLLAAAYAADMDIPLEAAVKAVEHFMKTRVGEECDGHCSPKHGNA